MIAWEAKEGYAAVAVVVLAVLVLLAAASAADAKGPRVARVCGASGCATVRNSTLTASAFQFNEPFMVLDAPRTAPYYRIEFKRLESPGFPSRYLYVPSRTRMRIDGMGSPYWRSVPSIVRWALERMTRGLQPYSAPRTWPGFPQPPNLQRLVW